MADKDFDRLMQILVKYDIDFEVEGHDNQDIITLFDRDENATQHYFDHMTGAKIGTMYNANRMGEYYVPYRKNKIL